MADVKLKVNKNIYAAWTKVNIYSTMDAISGIAELESVNFYQGNLSDWEFKLGDNFQLLIDDQLVMTGYIDQIDLIYKNRMHFLKLILRDKTADLVDCNWNEDVTEWKNQTVLNLTQNLCNPFNIQGASDSEVAGEIGKIIETFKINEGECISDAIMRYCNQFDLIPLSYGDGYLTLSKSTNTKKSYDAIDLNANVVSRIAVYSNLERFSNYIVKGMGCGTDQKNNYTDYIQPAGSVEDSVIQRYRPITFFDDVVTDAGKCEERAKWIKQVRAGQSRGLNYTVVGWGQSNGDIWRINRIVRVSDPMAGIDKDMLISSVRYTFRNEEGTKTELTVVDKNTYTKVQRDIKTEFDL
jgi:prophage tail gpP-like protein